MQKINLPQMPVNIALMKTRNSIAVAADIDANTTEKSIRFSTSLNMMVLLGYWLDAKAVSSEFNIALRGVQNEEVVPGFL